MTGSFWDQFVTQVSLRWGDLLSAIGQHIELVFFSMLAAMVIGIPAGILIARYQAFKGTVLGIANILQTVPSLALLGLLIPLLGIGPVTAITALFLYSLLPIIRNTYTGIKDVNASIIEAAVGMGLTRRQILFKVELPLALSFIMAGIRTATVINVGTATLAAFIGAGGLGDFIFLGISRNLDALILLGALPAAMLALVLDLLLGALERRTTPPGLKPS
ncbi:glycine/betaine ABC transporter [Paenibacillus sp. CAA11]|uniref:ABC transporter permease n=1 Tax=Paenibacillus sp. CAA11 TaxID=1532905 RepID=UPI000D3A3C5E|nr:ABC transporter permease [Paenibacillus sp. CAA11]AWB44449.1 glycine/betaine ABC transporter [Paenibacillus sp. CAA11]